MLLHLRSCEGSVSKDKKKGPGKAKIEKKTEKPSKKASFKRSGGTSKKSCLKAHIKTAPPNAGAGRAHFGKDLSVVPRQAWPDPERKNLSKHSYTLERGGACLEVLLLKQAYFVKKLGSGSGPIGQVSWSKFSCCSRMGVDVGGRRCEGFFGEIY